jgi:RNA polymerase sigma factor (sigma-70 family)
MVIPRSRRVSPESIQERPDAELVRAARDGDDAGAAFGELVRRHERGVYVLALSLLHDAAEAEDMAQEAFLRAFRNLDLLADPAKFGVWLRRIAFGVCVDWLRAFRPHLHQSLDAGDDSELAEPADAGPSPVQQLERAELAGRVLAALVRLPARYRVPFTLFHVDGLSHAKIAAALGTTEGTTRSLVARARRKLATLLADDPDAPRAPADPIGPHTTMDVLDDAPAAAPRLIHVLNGDAVRLTLERSAVPGTFAVWADALHEGPVLPDDDDVRTLERRARYHASLGYVPYAHAVAMATGWDATLATYRDYDEVVLWFEHDLFDQLLLARHLAWFARRERGRPALRLICIGEFAGVVPFHGLGQLDADQLASLLGTRRPVTAAHLALGTEVWRAFTAADPAALEAVMRRLLAPPPNADAELLPFMGGALRRMLEEYPSIDSGVGRTERQVLELLAEGARTPGELFVGAARREERVFMGDTTFWARLRGLAGGEWPLISTASVEWEEEPIPRGSVLLTDAGRSVLAGEVDAVRLRGIDRWIGGVHLVAAPGGDVEWRWNDSASRLDRRRLV